MILLYVQTAVALLGALVSAWLLVETLFDWRALYLSRRNGTAKILLRSDLIGESVRILIHLLVLAPTALGFWFFVIRGSDRQYAFGWVSGWLMSLTALVTLLSVIRWRTRVALRRRVRSLFEKGA